ncbi:histone-lysine N-methyltransferase SETMAR [Trichonephila clavipes]|nr:histone-lysine N-methyltransferase SETMAR [Trichonephila clavipes]
MLENNPHLTSRGIAEEFGIHHTTVGDYIKSLGFVLKQSVSVPHELTEKNLSDRVRMCVLIRHNAEPVFDKLITGDKKWILYGNIKRKKHTANQENHQQQFQNQVSINEKYCVVGQERSSVLQVAETGKKHQRGSILQSAG